jgi:NSS family neurotransmitter:Na+ symporter
MWRFSYVAAEGGGAAFVLLYVFFVAFIGVPLMTSEMVVGRLTQSSPVVALRTLGGSGWIWLGVLFVMCGIGILSFYSVIAGWTMRYAVDAFRGALPADTTSYFASVATGVPAIVTHVLFMGITVLIVTAGVKRGLERAAYALMPVLFLLLLGLALWAATLDQGGGGYAYYLRPDLSELLNPSTISRAAGQAFFSLSLGMGALMTFASYLRTKENLGRESAVIAACDFGVAFISGLVVFPIIFHFDLGAAIGLGGAVTDNTVGTLFIAMPAAVASLGGLGQYVIGAFFLMLFLAAVTSSISLLEVATAAAVDGLRWTRRRAAIVFGLLITLLGIPSARNLNFLDFLDKFVGAFLLIVGGLLTCIFVGFRVLPQAEAELAHGLDDSRARHLWAVFVRYVAPPVLLFVAGFSLIAAIAAFRTWIAS